MAQGRENAITGKAAMTVLIRMLLFCLAQPAQEDIAFAVNFQRAGITLQGKFAEGVARVLDRCLVKTVSIPQPAGAGGEVKTDQGAILPLDHRVQPPQPGIDLGDFSREVAVDIDEMHAGLEYQQPGHVTEIRLAGEKNRLAPAIAQPRAA